MKRIAFLFVIAVIGSSVGCAGTRGPSPAARSVPEGIRTDIITSIQRRNDAVHSLRGEASVRYGGSVFGARGQTAFALKEPSRLRIDGLAEFGLYSSQLALNGNTLTILWPSDNRYFTGPATPEAFARYVLIGLPPETIVNILTGFVPVRSDDPGLRVAAQGRRGYLLRSERVTASVEVKDGEYVVREYTVTDHDGAPIYRVTFDDYAETGAVSLAKRMTARFWENGPSRTKARVEVDYKSVEINPKLDDKLFELKVPKDAERIPD